MPRQMGELRRLNVEWNDLVQIARGRGMRYVMLESGRRVRLVPRAHFQMARVEARDRVRSLRNSVAPYFAPTVSGAADQDTFGVEIEMIMPQRMRDEELAQAIRDAGVLCQAERYNHITRTHWKVTTDSSLGSGGREIVSPPLSGEAGLEQVRRVCSTLISRGCRVNLRCGLHVHIGAQRHQDIGWFKNMLEMNVHFESAIDSFMAPSRRRGGRGSYFCEPIRLVRAAFDGAINLSQLCTAVGQPQHQGARSVYRYRRVNLLSFLQYGTIEFRQHQGTVEPQKTEMWVRLLLRMAKKAAELGTDAMRSALANGRTLEAMLHFLECDAGERSYFIERRNYFANMAYNPAAFA
jgi:hypothetical protein